MNLLINPAALPNPAAANIEQNSTSGKAEGSFLSFMTRKMMGDKGQNLLGVTTCREARGEFPQVSNPAAARLAGQGRSAADGAAPASVTARLRDLLDNLSQSMEQGKTTAGEWMLSLPDPSLLTRTAQDAGMSRADLDGLLEKMEENGGWLDLTEILAFFSNHLASLEADSPIPLPETELPFLESLLARMGVSQEEIQKISAAALAGDNQFDLKVFVRELNDLLGQAAPASTAPGATNDLVPQTIFLTNGEKEQLLDLLRQAGADGTMLAFLFQAAGEEPDGFGLAELKDMLSQGVDLVEQQRPKFAPGNFFADLARMLSETGFDAKPVALTPMVQKAVESLYRELLGMVDLGGQEAAEAPAAPLTHVMAEEAEDDRFAPDPEKTSRLFNQAPERLRDLLKRAGVDKELLTVLLGPAGTESGEAVVAPLRQGLAQGQPGLDRLEPQALIAALAAGETGTPAVVTIQLTSQEKDRLLNLFQQAGAGIEQLAALFEPAGTEPDPVSLAQFRQVLVQGLKAMEAKGTGSELVKLVTEVSQVLAAERPIGQPEALPAEPRVALALDLAKAINTAKSQAEPAEAGQVEAGLARTEAMPARSPRGSEAAQVDLAKLFAGLARTLPRNWLSVKPATPAFDGRSAAAAQADGLTANPDPFTTTTLGPSIAAGLDQFAASAVEPATAANPDPFTITSLEPSIDAGFDPFVASAVEPATLAPVLEVEAGGPLPNTAPQAPSLPAMDTVTELSSRNAELLTDLLKQAGIADRAQDEVVYLSGQDKARLLDLFRQAGVSDEQLAVIFAQAGDEAAGLPVPLLKEMLAQGVKAVELAQTQPQADLSKLFADLGQVLSGAVLPEPAGDMTPVVRQTMDSVFQELVGTVDAAQIEPRPKTAGPEPVKKAETDSPVMTRPEKPAPAVDNDEAPSTEIKQMTAVEAKSRPANAEPTAERSTAMASDKPETTVIGQAESSPGQARQAAALRQVHVPRSAPDFERQALMQMTSGVLRGLRTGEHHLVLKLRPPELGEVRVELLVKNQQVSINFAMENGKVKEILENNMGMFKEHMADKGFNLQECKVSVGQDNQQKDSWQRFAQDFRQKSNGPAPAKLSDLSRDVLYNRPEALYGRPDGISIVV